MFKLVVLSALLTVAAARPSLIESHSALQLAPAATIAVQEPVLTRVGSVVKSIPTAVSHQSSTIVHSSAHVVEDIVAPALRTSVVAAPALVQSVAAAPAVVQTVAAAPTVVQSVAAAPALVQSVAAAPVLHSAAVQTVAAAPLLQHAPIAASPLAHGLW
ncbi:retinin-like isoform X1 [Bactrocera dorsalis]|uniref:Retinin-like isoform X1 n=1 Tax=Bactrocera dorsalis TaxID=27457 RepID=A0ABM3JXC7_BACDO|nr:retinin-like isoform X1 [Bactrocera dorsalis]